jgi:excisionase family DNA binding protein
MFAWTNAVDQNATSRRVELDAALALARTELPTPEYLNTTQAAAYLGFTRKNLEHWRSAGCGPAYFKVGRHVRYGRTDLDAWMAQRRLSNTAQEVRS